MFIQLTSEDSCEKMSIRRRNDSGPTESKSNPKKASSGVCCKQGLNRFFAPCNLRRCWISNKMFLVFFSDVIKRCGCLFPFSSHYSGFSFQFYSTCSIVSDAINGPPYVLPRSMYARSWVYAGGRHFQMARYPLYFADTTPNSGITRATELQVPIVFQVCKLRALHS